MKCVRCHKEHSNTANEMCYKCFTDIQASRKAADKKKVEIRKRRRNAKRFAS